MSKFLLFIPVLLAQWGGAALITASGPTQRMNVPRSLPTSNAGSAVFVESEGYFPALSYDGKAAEATFKTLTVVPYQSEEGTTVKSGQNLVCARTAKMEGIEEIISYQCFMSIHPTGATYPGYLQKDNRNPLSFH